MSDEFMIAPEQFRRYATLIGEVGEQLRQAQRSLARNLHAEGSCWGTDDPGSAFEGAYGPKGKTAFDNTDRAATHLRNLHIALIGSAGRAEAQESNNATANRIAGR